MLRRRDKTPSHTISVFRQSLMASVGETQMVEKHQFDIVDHGVKIIEGCCRNAMLL